jgi:hypothetical protein
VSRARVCGPVCHEATENTCNCWCAGLFHGAGGQPARVAFADAMGELPGREPDGTETAHLENALEAARAVAPAVLPKAAAVGSTAPRWLAA